MKDFSFQGKVYLGTRLAGGKPGALRWVGDAPKCDLTLQSTTEKRQESYTGQRLTSGVLDKGKDASIALSLNWGNIDNLALGLYGASATVASGSVTGELLPTGLIAGDAIALQHGGVSSLVITDSAGTPATLTPGTDYKLDSANGGIVDILNVGTYVQPFKASYSHTAGTDVAMFSTPAPERYLLLDGVNTIDNSPVRVRLYRCKFQPAANFALINPGYGTLDLTGEVLYDEEAAADASLGGFGKIEQRAAAA